MSVSRAIALVLSVAVAVAAGRVFAGGFAGLGTDAEGFAKVVPGKAVTFPADFGSHPAFRIEWWYLTSNLKDAAGNSYGVQWTLFRQSLAPGEEAPGFANQQVWMGHAALTTATEHRVAEKLARGGIGQAGVEASPFRAWIDDWTFDTVQGAEGIGKTRLSASGDGFEYRLDLTTARPPVLQGDNGYSRKSDLGQASYYYSQPFFDVSGSLMVDGRSIDVTGVAWMDREWSSQPLAADQKGWDWLSLHLPQGEKLMLFQLRSTNGPAYRSGNWIARDGHVTALASDDIVLEPLDVRTVAGRDVPVAWRVTVKSRGLSIDTVPLNSNSWMETVFPYWEGPIRFEGSHAGEGYLEMTGY
jgi:predicted secreted hydrolase